MKDDFDKKIATDVGASIRARRLSAGMSQDQLAERLEVGPEAVSRMERGVVMPTIPRLVELANVLNCPVEAFIPTASGSTQSGAHEIAQLLQALDKNNMKFVVEIVQKLTSHLKREH
ncbi:helix-turn-helix domain-containing protein [Paracidovorax valerianellae]|uniref:helix-turn-helix domain-containing protein n=1 Tax=Paracidovorax valerianellae TaxID=187868 RepID=UPI000B8A2FA1|nr:helix-turn-helix transcriptional regulator [Paracidovorax valerianellae]MDA8447877.1 helix-turn-helix domain-containing protein [Paracidovorax valerianellae]